MNTPTSPFAPKAILGILALSLTLISCAAGSHLTARTLSSRVTVRAEADKQVEDLLSHMRDAYKGVKGATFTTDTTIMPESGVDQKFTLNWAYKSPNMIRTIMKGEALQGTTVTRVTDGKKITTSSTEGSGPDQEYSHETYAKALPCNLESICFFDWSKQLSTSEGNNMANSTFSVVKDEEWNDKHWIVLEETAKKDNVFCRYFIDPKTYFIWRTNVKSLDTKKDQMDCRISDLNPNADLDDNMFKGA